MNNMSLFLCLRLLLLFVFGIQIYVFRIQSYNSNFTNSLENLIACAIYMRCDGAIHELRDRTQTNRNERNNNRTFNFEIHTNTYVYQIDGKIFIN